jgi:heterodisulfide reductase subunit A-like polyferredoxin
MTVTFCVCTGSRDAYPSYKVFFTMYLETNSQKAFKNYRSNTDDKVPFYNFDAVRQQYSKFAVICT